jgi:haloalkane dehalogenase
LRIHYLDEGPPEAAPILLLHGEPSWSFLYRHMVPVLVDAGHRCVVPDLVGFGRSDKPTEQSDHTFARHVGWMAELVFDHLDLTGITLVCQDWGGLIGLRLVGAEPDRFARVVVANTGLPTGDRPPTDAFLAWQKFSQETPTFPVGMIVNGGCTTELSPEVVAGYDAPFPDETYKAGPRIMPSLVPTSPDDPVAADNRAAWEVLSRFDRPLLCAFSDCDPITKGGDRVFLSRVPGAAGQPHTTIEGGGHFLQEDRGPELARVVADFIAATP